jgi:hypothetical protein
MFAKFGQASDEAPDPPRSSLQHHLLLCSCQLFLWLIFHGIYQWSHNHFDDDFIICCTLTNKAIKIISLNEDDKFSRKKDFPISCQEFSRKKEGIMILLTLPIIHDWYLKILCGCMTMLHHMWH